MSETPIVSDPRETVRVRTTTGWRMVPGVLVAPGLAVTPEVQGMGWVITHRASGYRIGFKAYAPVRFESETAAAIAA